MTNTDPNSNNDTLKVLKTLTEFPKDGFSKTKAFIIR